MAQLVSALFYGSYFLPREGSSYLNDLLIFFYYRNSKISGGVFYISKEALAKYM